MPYDSPLVLPPFDKVDPGGNITLTTFRSAINDLSRNVRAHVSKDLGGDLFTREVKWTFKPISGNGSYDTMAAVCNAQSDWYNLVSRGIASNLFINGATALAVFHEKPNTGAVFNQAFPNVSFTLNVQYWAKMVISLTRADIFYYTDAAMQNPQGTHGLNLSFTPDATWKYLMVAGSLFSGSGVTMSCWSENYQLLSVAAPAHIPPHAFERVL